MKKFIPLFLSVIALQACSHAGVKPNPEASEIKRAQAKLSRTLYSPVCPAPANIQSDRCGLVVQDSEDSAQLMANFAARYPKADKQSLISWCEASPFQCQNAPLFELQWMDSHNAAAMAEFKKAEKLAKLHGQQQADLAGSSAALQMHMIGNAAMQAGQAASQAASQAATMSMMAPAPMMMAPMAR